MTSPPPTRPLGLRLSPPRLLVVLSTTLSEAHPKTNTGEESALGLRCKCGRKRMKFIDIIANSMTRSCQSAHRSSNSSAEGGIKLTSIHRNFSCCASANTDEIHFYLAPLHDRISSTCSTLIQLIPELSYSHPSSLLLVYDFAQVQTRMKFIETVGHSTTKSCQS